MATTAEFFICQFHNIEGNTVTERKKNLYLILKSARLSPNEQKLMVENLKPTNYLETVFHADLLIYLKEIGALMELLKTGNEVYVSKIIKQPWFFEKVFTDIPPNQLVEEVLPKLSYCVKLKVLKKLLTLLPSHQIDDIFDILLRRYGLYFATKILSGCSETKIENILMTSNIILSTADLKIIHKKNSDLIKTYFNELSLRKKCDINRICDDTFYKYLAKNDPIVFWEIIEKYKPICSLKLGRRITKKILPLVEEKIINEPNSFINYFNQNKVVQVLNKQGKFPELYKNLFPDEIIDLSRKKILTSILDYYPEQKRYALFRDTFERVFKEDVWENRKFVDDYFLDSLKEKDLQIKWAQLKYNETNNIEYIKYYDTETSTTLLKQRINVTSNNLVRSNLLGLLLKSCAVNKDIMALEQVLQYFCERHRNDDGNVREAFLDNFKKLFEKKVSTFTETIWKYFIEIVTIQLVNQEHGLNYSIKLILKYIEYLYKKNEDTKVENAINKFFPGIMCYYNFTDSMKDFKNPELERKILLYTCQLLENMEKSSVSQNCYKKILPWLYTFNKNNCDKSIVYDKNMIDLIKRGIESIHKSEYYLFLPLCSDILCKSNLNDLEQELSQFLWEKEFINGESLANEPLCPLQIIRYNPSVIIPHFDNLVKTCLKSNLKKIRFWPYLRFYSHLGLDAIIKKNCLNNLQNKDNIFVKCNSIIALSYFLCSDEYIQAMKDCNLFPTKYKFDVENQEETTTFKIQKDFIKMLKNTNEPSQYLLILLEQLCQGDFLQDSLPPLYKTFYRLPEEFLKPYLNILSEKKNISLQKHAAVLACNVLDQSTAIQTLQMFMESKNQSLKTAVFSRALKYFCKNPSRETFDIMLELMKFLTEQNIETLKYLFSAKIDKNYLEEYLQNAWVLLESYKDNSEINNIKLMCLKSFEQISIKNIPVNFCKDIIKAYFLSDKQFQTSEEINQFVVNFLLTFNQENHFAFVFDIILIFKSKFWTKYKASHRKEINNFVKTFIKHVCKKKINSSVIVKFFKFWKTTFSLYENFEDYLLIKFAEIWKTNNDTSIFSNHVVKYLEENNKEYEYVFSSFAISFSEFLKLLDDENVKLDIMYEITSTFSTLSCILVIELLLREKFIRNNKILKKYCKINNELEKMLSNDLVTLKYNSLLRQS